LDLKCVPDNSPRKPQVSQKGRIKVLPGKVVEGIKFLNWKWC